MTESPGESRIVDTRDLDEARALVGQRYCDHALRVLADAQSFHALQTETRVGGVRLHRLTYGADVRVSAGPLDNSLLVTSPTRGHLTVTSGRVQIRCGVGDVVALGPDRPFRLDWEENCELQTVQIQRSTIQAAAEHAGLPDVSRLFAVPHSATTRDARSWHQLLRLIRVEADNDSFEPLPTFLVNRLETLLTACVVHHHAAGAEVAEALGSPQPTPRHLRRAVDFIEACADRAITVADIADAAGLSVRGLQVGFRRYLSYSPSAYLRMVRLERAHDDLRSLDVTTATVTEIAFRWEFGNLGRFSSLYRQRYGELPSYTLRR